MAKDIYDKLRLIPELVKTYWMIAVMLGSLSTGGWHWWDKQDYKDEQAAAQKQIAEIANHYAAPKTVTVKSNCDKCMYEIKRLREEYH